MDGFQAVVSLVMVKFLNDLNLLGVMGGVLCGVMLTARYPEVGRKVNNAVTTTVDRLHHALCELGNEPATLPPTNVRETVQQ